MLVQGRGFYTCGCGGRRKSSGIPSSGWVVQVSAYIDEMAELGMMVMMPNELIHNNSKYIESEVLVLV